MNRSHTPASGVTPPRSLRERLGQRPLLGKLGRYFWRALRLPSTVHNAQACLAELAVASVRLERLLQEQRTAVAERLRGQDQRFALLLEAQERTTQCLREELAALNQQLKEQAARLDEFCRRQQEEGAAGAGAWSVTEMLYAQSRWLRDFAAEQRTLLDQLGANVHGRQQATAPPDPLPQGGPTSGRSAA